MLGEEEKGSPKEAAKVSYHKTKTVTLAQGAIYDKSTNIHAGGNISGNLNTGKGTIQDCRDYRQQFFYEAERKESPRIKRLRTKDWEESKAADSEELGTQIVEALKKRYHQDDMTLDSVLRSGTDEFTPSVCYVNLTLVEEAARAQSKEKEEKSDKKEQAAYQDERIVSYENLYNVHKPLAIKAMFDPIKLKDKDLPVKKLFIAGRAGIGKTILCHYFVDQWQTGALQWQQPFEAVFFVRLRELADRIDTLKQGNYFGFQHYQKTGEKTADLGWILEQLLFDQKNAPKRQALQRYVETHSDKILWLLDGYDEVADRVGNAQEDLSMLFKALGNQPWVILTSRPGAQPRADQFKADRVIENMGFTNENIKAYVTAYFKDDPTQDTEDSDEEEEKGPISSIDHTVKGSASTQMLQWLEGNGRLWGIAHVPINLRLICETFQSCIQQHHDKTLPSNLGGLYTQLVSKTKARKIQKVRSSSSKRKKQIPLFPLLQKDWGKTQAQDYPSIAAWENNTKQPWDWASVAERYLMRLGFEAMAQEQIILSPKLLKETAERHIKAELGVKRLEEDGELEDLCHCLLQACHHLGFLKVTGKRDQILGQVKAKRSKATEDFLSCSHVFIHLSFQEYFAARWVAENLGSERILKAIQKNKYHPRYQLVWWFTAGYLADQKDAKKLTQWFQGLSKAPKDVSGFQHARLLMHSLEEVMGYKDWLASKAADQFLIAPLKQYFSWIQQVMVIKEDKHYYRLKLVYKNVLNELVRCVQLWSLDWIQQVWFTNYAPIKQIQDVTHSSWVGCIIPWLPKKALLAVMPSWITVLKGFQYHRGYQDLALTMGNHWIYLSESTQKQLLVLLKDGVRSEVRGNIARALVNQWVNLSESDQKRLFPFILSTLKYSKDDNEYVGVDLARALMNQWVHLSESAQKQSLQVVLSFMRNIRKGSHMTGYMFDDLVRALKIQWLHLLTMNELVQKKVPHFILVILKDSQVSYRVRSDLACVLVNQWPHLSESDQKQALPLVLAVLKDGKAGKYLRRDLAREVNQRRALARALVNQWPHLSESDQKQALPLVFASEVDKSLRRDLASALANQWAHLSESAQKQLLAVPKDSQTHGDIRSDLVYSLSKQWSSFSAEAQKQAFSIILAVLKDSKDDKVRGNLASALANQWPHLSESAQRQLLAFLKESKDDKVRGNLARALANQWPHLSESAQRQLLAFLKESKVSKYVSRNLAESIKNRWARLSDSAREQLFPVVLDFLKDSKDDKVRGNLARALGNHWVNLSESAQKQLLDVLKDSKDDKLRSNLACALGDKWKYLSESAQEQSLPTFLTALKDSKDDQYVRSHLAYMLVNQWVHLNESAKNQSLLVVFAVLKDSKDDKVRGNLARALGNQWSHLSESAQKQLLALLKDIKDDEARGNLATALGNQWPHLSESAQKQLLALLKDIKDDKVRGQLATALVNKWMYLSEAAQKQSLPIVLTFIKDGRSTKYMLSRLAEAMENQWVHLSQSAKNQSFPAILALLQDSQYMFGGVFGGLARAVVTQWSSLSSDSQKQAWPVLLAFLDNEQLSESLRSDLVRALGNQYASLSLDSQKQAWPTLRVWLANEDVSKYVRGDLARAVVTQWSSLSEPAQKQLLSFLANEQVSYRVRVDLAEAVVTQWSSLSEPAQKQLLSFLANEQLSEYVRGDLALAVLTQWSSLSSDSQKQAWTVFLALLANEQLSRYVRGYLATAVKNQWLSLSEPAQKQFLALLTNEQLSKYVRSDLARAMHLPVVVESVNRWKNDSLKKAGIQWVVSVWVEEGYGVWIASEKQMLHYSEGRQLQSLELQEDTLQLIQEQFELVTKNMPWAWKHAETKLSEESEEKRNDSDTRAGQETKNTEALSIDSMVKPARASEFEPFIPQYQNQKLGEEKEEIQPKPGCCKCVIL